MSLKSFDIIYDDIISLDNLLAAWQEFLRGKRDRADVQLFQLHLMDHILDLQYDLRNKIYAHSSYEAFNISDPKPRHIHKASVRDRLLHHAIYRQFYPMYERTFIHHSYSCQKNKGTHKALDAFTIMARQISNNHTKTCWVLKCDIKKFFASIDQQILLHILKQKIVDPDTVWLLGQVINSFQTEYGKGLPLGNLTSQLLVNIYMNKFDQFMKHELHSKYYIRYADDFAILDQDKEKLSEILNLIKVFLRTELQLELHPKKVSISTFASGVDFLGWVHFSQHRTLRTVTKRRMFKSVVGLETDSLTVQSYLGLLSHGDAYGLQNKIK